ncbi:MAG: Mechanosensitive channel MscK [Phycisphaerae bacterium]|nr:Mechanosensitive channel MscK [Phycisphaerae bacterium]
MSAEMTFRLTGYSANAWRRASKRRAGCRAATVLIAAALLARPASAQTSAASQPADPQTAPASQPASTSAASEPAATPRRVEPSAAEISAERVREEMARIQADTTLSDTARAAALKLCEDAIAQLAAAEQNSAKAAGFAEMVAGTPDQLDQVNQELSRPLVSSLPAGEVEPPSSQPAVASILSKLEAELAAQRDRLAAAQQALANWDIEISQRAERLIKIPEQRTRGQEQLAALTQQLTAQAGPAESESESAELASARRLLLLAQKRAIESRLETLRQEHTCLTAQGELLAKRRDLAARDVVVAQESLDIWQSFVDEQRAAAAARAQRDAELAREEALRRDPQLAQLFDRNAELSRASAEVAERIKQLEAEAATIEAVSARLKAEQSDIQTNVAAVGATDLIATLLRESRNALPDLRVHRRRMGDVDEEFGRAALEQKRYAEQRRALGVVAVAVNDFLNRLVPAPSEAQRQSLSATVQNELSKRQQILDELAMRYGAYRGALARVRFGEKTLIDLSTALRAYIDEHILWVRSNEPLKWQDTARLRDGVVWLADPFRWQAAVRLLRADFTLQPLTVGFSIAALVALAAGRPFFTRRLRRISDDVGRMRTDRFTLTIRALFCTAAIAGPVPAALGILAWRLVSAAGDPLAAELARAASADTAFAFSVSAGLAQFARAVFIFELIRYACRPSGLCDAHFRWPAHNLRVVRVNFLWIIVVAAPSILLTTMAETLRGDELSAIARAAFLVTTIATAVFMFRVLSPRRGLLRDTLRRFENGWLNRLRYVWFPAVVLLPLFLGTLAALGYYYGALQIHRRIAFSIWLIAGTLIAHALMLRLIFIEHRRLAIEQFRRRRDALKAEAREAGRVSEAGETQVVVEEPEVDLSMIDVQTRKLLRSAFFFGLLIGGWLIWSDVLPALGFLRNFELISAGTAEVAAAPDVVQPAPGAPMAVAPPADGSPAVAPSARGALTLADLVAAAFIAVVTVILSRNIPGLLEIAVLQKLPLEPSARYAITTISSYVISIIGIILAFAAVGVGWSKVQWLAAAVTVGLGFGLQEIFANFVSGLIILFERPIRVGDTVTVGAITGTVSRIRIRATTITDWDRRELIIPNKDLITGQVINWTLTDPLARLIVPVGVAYGADIALARTILNRIAAATPNVLEKPAPYAVFVGFGESTLNLELRVFVNHVDNSLAVRDTINYEINRQFAEAGIAIAFPQRDVHVHLSPSAQTALDLRRPVVEET